MNLKKAAFAAIVALMLYTPVPSFAASIYLEPEASTFGLGDTFIMTVRLDNEDECINAVNVELTYPKDTLRAVDFGRGDSIFSLWAVEPKLDTNNGTVVFAGGIPGGYCGRIAGDAALSNTLGRVVFTVIDAKQKSASVGFGTNTSAYVSDGLGTKASVTVKPSLLTILPTPVQDNNPWLVEVAKDTTPPQPFTVDMQSTVGVFGGRYYVVFATTDKESGLDHFEIFERGGWKKITSPYVLNDQSLLGVGEVKIRAVDKAGNVREGLYTASSTPQRQYEAKDFLPLGIIIVLLLAIGMWMRRKGHFNPPTQPTQP